MKNKLEQENTKIAQFEDIINDFKVQNEDQEAKEVIEDLCLTGFKQIRLASKFTKIDEEILNLSTKNDEQDSSFFTNLLYLESKRLRFKEEVLKCSKIPHQKRVKI